MSANMNTKLELNMQNCFVVVAHIMIIEEGKWRKVSSENAAATFSATFLVRIFRKLHRSGAAPCEGYCECDIHFFMLSCKELT